VVRVLVPPHRVCRTLLPAAWTSGVCSVCAIHGSDDVVPLITIGCGHGCCADCWRGHLTAQRDISQAVFGYTKCPQAPQCEFVVPLPLFQAFLSEVEFQRLVHTAVKRFSLPQHVRLCPEGVCIVVKGPAATSDAVPACACRPAHGPRHRHFCFTCAAEHHFPISCSDAAKWNVKIDEMVSLISHSLSVGCCCCCCFHSLPRSPHCLSYSSIHTHTPLSLLPIRVSLSSGLVIFCRALIRQRWPIWNPPRASVPNVLFVVSFGIRIHIS
jgi:hypothetical protein